MIALDTLLADPRVQVLLTAARHAHSAMTFDVSLGTQRRAAANLDFALQPFEHDEPRETLTNLKTVAAAASGAGR